MGKGSSHSKSKSAGSKELRTSAPSTAPQLATPTKEPEPNGTPPYTMFMVQSPMMARFLSDSEAPFTGLPGAGAWEQNITLQPGRTTMTARAVQGSASGLDEEEVNDHVNTEKKSKKKRGKQSKADKVDSKSRKKYSANS